MKMRIVERAFIKDNPLSHYKNNNLRLLLGFCGVPGSGKTTIANAIAKKFMMVRIATDDLKQYFRKNGKNYQLSDLFFCQENLINFYLSNGVSVIADSNFDKQIYRDKLEILGKTKGCKVVFVYCQVSQELAWERIKERKCLKNEHDNIHLVSQERLLQFFGEQEKPNICLQLETDNSLDDCLRIAFNKLVSMYEHAEQKNTTKQY